MGGTAAALRPLQITLLDRMEQGRDDFFSRIEEYWGRRIQYGSMGPSIFGVLDIRDVRVLRDDGSVLLSISRLRLSYSLASIVQGNVFDSFHSARFDRPVLNLDFEKDADLLERLAIRSGQNGAIAADRLAARDLIPEKFSLRIWNGEWDASGARGRISISGVELDASARQNRLSFQGSWNVSGGLNGQAEPETAAGFAPIVRMSARISGEYRRDRDEGRAAVTIPSFSGDLFRLNPLTLDFSLSGGVLEAAAAIGGAPFARAVYEFESGRLAGNAAGDNFPLSDMLTFTGAWARHNPLLGLLVSGNASVERDAGGGLAYAADFTAFFPENAPFAQASAAFRAWGNESHAAIDTLQVRSSDGALDFSGGIDLQEWAPYGLLSLAEFGLGAGHGISGDFSISSQGRDIRVSGEGIAAGDAGLSVLAASFFREDAGFSFVLSAENAREGTLLLEGSVDNSPRQLRAVLALDSFPAGDLFSFAEPLAPLPGIPSLARYAAGNTYIT
ncbi:MAG: hypothetical protein FWC65_05580, partial [Treponema sp.]|nr:hypothetical protein [Treponema sp.]